MQGDLSRIYFLRASPNWNGTICPLHTWAICMPLRHRRAHRVPCDCFAKEKSNKEDVRWMQDGITIIRVKSSRKGNASGVGFVVYPSAVHFVDLHEILSPASLSSASALRVRRPSTLSIIDRTFDSIKTKVMFPAVVDQWPDGFHVRTSAACYRIYSKTL